MTNSLLERLLELERERHDECNEAEWLKWHDDYDEVKYKLNEKLEKLESVLNGTIYEDINGIKGKHAFCILAKDSDVWIADSYDNLINFSKLEQQIKQLKEENNQRCYFCNHKRESHPSWQSNGCCVLISSVSSGTSPRDCKCPCSIYGNPETGMPEYYPIRDGVIDRDDEKNMLKFKNKERKSILDNSENLKYEIQSLKSQLEIYTNKTGHFPELAFRNGKAYCKKCGGDLE